MRKLVVLVLILGLATGFGWWHYNEPNQEDGSLVLHGNVDIRQVSLAFTLSERIVEMSVEEGDRVQAGQVLARLDTDTLSLQIARTRAAISAQQQQVQKLHKGSRREEIAQAQALVEAARADVELALSRLNRVKDVERATQGRGISAQDIDTASAQLKAARAQLANREQTQALAKAGPRVEDIAQAEAQLKALQADLALQQHQVALSTLKAPVDAVIRSRLLEPGDIASAQRPVYTLALSDPKWIRVYVSEPDLGRIRPGMTAQVFTDTDPENPVTGQVGYISSVAEFTPKTVQTESLRTALVYEVRIRVKDPADRLRLGMPATVRIETDASADDSGHS
ncbi:putative membrane fusion protein (MFP) component of efflux pump, membrane anchor protein YbhG [Marinobacterium lacunae]|uniref:Putative membrane fusion protein (MFP) component of efflux pump, membrane anchor protein YbhG n=1 Tax=Marinobacterium lacunae TaxID=1232683 RepID=A0A081G1L8_9GAMM|nr:HlyD family efflux transporter periplasmic adaptor subunit [Marinobacterium lacunae]KEA64673.1 putative membrane fusion protein (MFP) component of efflux pump, membrane anchor protein YbhG [Marinobacterium lacunae]MBR9886024.1 HlyD family efflux transporter periplasmic adaptor subunit [Oceanospirillales bacterium]